MGKGNSKHLVAILIHQPSQWPEALSAAQTLSQAGAAVMLFCLGLASMKIDPPISDESGIECYADTCQIGMAAMPLEAIAQRLKQCDLVIPI